MTRRWSRWLPACLACGWLAFGTPAPALAEVLLNRVSNLRLISLSADNTEAVLVAQYQYDGLRGPTARLMPVIEKRGHPGVAAWFETRRATVGRGWGSVTFRVIYRPDTSGAPPAISTDKVTINMMAGDRWLILGAPFLQTINWGLPAAEARETKASGLASPEPERRFPTRREAVELTRRVGGRRSDEFAAGEQVRKEQTTLHETQRQSAPVQGATTGNGSAGLETNVNAPPPPQAAVARAVAPAAEDRSPPASVPADEPAEEANESRLALSATAPVSRAPWQERLTLGPGDVLNLSLFGDSEVSRAAVRVGPDGRISFLEAQDVMATGRTIDELRTELDSVLSKYRRAPRTIVTPVSFGSKKYFVLGAVAKKGVFTLDRPLTIVEAVARAGGLETSLARRKIVDAADLSRSFLVRQGKRWPVDFEKLFHAGDLSQNIALEPADYLYFPPGDLREVYVLGEVGRPGPVPFDSDLTALRAIIMQGGFTPQAWNRKVVVVRGSLTKPELLEVNATAVLSATTKDFQLQPKDIVYVSARPWVKAEELLDAAATAFVQSAVVTWTGLHAGPLVR